MKRSEVRSISTGAGPERLSGKPNLQSLSEDSTLIDQGEAIRMKKTYERPAVVHTEKLEARAVSCNKADDASCGAGPIQS